MDSKDVEIAELKKQIKELKLILDFRFGAIERTIAVLATVFLLALIGILLR